MQTPKIHLLCGLLCDQTVWQPVIPHLPADHAIRIFNFYGFDSITAMAESVLQADEGPFVLIGHSMGARVALEIAKLAPQRVQKLALLDTGIHAVKTGEAEKRYALLSAAQQYGMSHLLQNWLMPMLAPANRNNCELIEPLSDMILRTDTNVFSQQIKALLNRPDAQSALAAITCPLLLGVGEHDEWSPPAQHQTMQQIAPHAQLHVFSGCGHMAPFEQGGQVGRILADWLV